MRRTEYRLKRIMLLW